VRLLPRRAGSSEEVATADLVVDATGRGSRTPQWLRELGYPTPRVERVEVGVSLHDAAVPRRPGDLGGSREL
jgi:hypothetical protein